MRDERFPEEFSETIRTSWWTSCFQVLPGNERARGSLLRPGTLVLAVLLASAGAAPGQDSTRVSGGVYLFHYRPIDLSGVDPKTEVYALFATFDRRSGPWTIHVQGRARDTKLRPFFSGNVWLQEAWVSYQATPSFSAPSLTLRAGKIYQTLGRFWDGSFFGNIHYYDGLKLNPQFGLEASGSVPLGPGALGYAVQYILASDRVSGAFAGRDFETLDGFQNLDGGGIRTTLALVPGVTLGASFLSRSVDTAATNYQVPHVALDAEVGFPAGPAVAYVEWTRRGHGSLPSSRWASVPGSRATYWLAGFQVNAGGLHARYNFSRASYDDLGRQEWIRQPGITLDLASHVHGIVDFDLWRVSASGATTTFDRSLSLVLLLDF